MFTNILCICRINAITSLYGYIHNLHVKDIIISIDIII